MSSPPGHSSAPHGRSRHVGHRGLRTQANERHLVGSGQCGMRNDRRTVTVRPWFGTNVAVAATWTP